MTTPKTLRQKLRSVGLLLVCPLLLQELPANAVAEQGLRETQGNNTEVCKDLDSYQIYAALLRSEKHSQYVILTETSAYPGTTVKQLGIKGNRAFMRAWGSTMDDFARQNQNAQLLTHSIPIDMPYELVARPDIFKSESGQPGWDNFYHRYPLSGGFYWFSSIGFNPQRTRAIVKMNHACGMLCGDGAPHFFEKKGTVWREVSVRATLSVWFS